MSGCGPNLEKNVHRDRCAESPGLLTGNMLVIKSLHGRRPLQRAVEESHERQRLFQCLVRLGWDVEQARDFMDGVGDGIR